ncbi:putative UPF0481 protein At3g02645 [Diospyros lotus]|uniref:putative UPF0481 protein At3g02645 n=1 Tax=Diospyros lotus TaxID=55363 RepID=UPI0022560B8E|nr:putative UPF0481 protein At3g02645 [Diospyros lotus]
MITAILSDQLTNELNTSSSGGKRFAEMVKEMLQNPLDPHSVCFSAVPRWLSAAKPEAFAPQLIGLGPYHHMNPKFLELERFKLLGLSNVLRKRGVSFDDLVGKVTKFEITIRGCYHRFLDLDGDTLASVVAIDGLFLIDFMSHHSQADDGDEKKDSSKRSKRASDGLMFASKKLTKSGIIADVLMLENQFPIKLLTKLCETLSSTEEDTQHHLSEMYRSFASFTEKISPLKLATISSSNPDFFNTQIHLLESLHTRISPNPEKHAQHFEMELPEAAQEPSAVTGNWPQLAETIGRIFLPLTSLFRVLQKHIRLLLSAIPWNQILGLVCPPKSGDIDVENPVLEIAIPSVTQLADAGVKFNPVEAIKDIKFDPKTCILHLSAIKLRSYTEVVIRNLIAFEATHDSGTQEFARYVDMMCGMVDTAGDAKQLRESKIIDSKLGEEEIAGLFNGISRFRERPKEETNVTNAIYGVNEYYSGTCRVKSYEMMKKYVFASWRILAVLGTLVGLSLMGLQSFCQVYGCSYRFFSQPQPAAAAG